MPDRPLLYAALGGIATNTAALSGDVWRLYPKIKSMYLNGGRWDSCSSCFSTLNVGFVSGLSLCDSGLRRDFAGAGLLMWVQK
jgi:hypothetical protein